MKAIDAGTDGTITLTAPVTARCPHDDTRDRYTVEITYRPADWAVELQSLAEYLDGYHDREVTQERLAEQLYRDLKDLLAPAALLVTVRGEHYGIVSEVRRQ